MQLEAPPHYSRTLLVLTVAWLVVFAGCLALLAAEPMVRSGIGCNVPGHDSDPGEVHWQWSPPGTYCALPPGAGYPAETPRTWGHPSAWRWLVVAGFAGTAVALVVAYARPRGRESEPERHEIARRRSRS